MFNKISKYITAQAEMFTEKFQRFQLKVKGVILRQGELETEKTPPIRGEMTVEDIEDFLRTLYENYEMMQSQYQDTRDEIFLEMAMDTQLAISEIDEVKGFLMERGRYAKNFANFRF